VLGDLNAGTHSLVLQPRIRLAQLGSLVLGNDVMVFESPGEQAGSPAPQLALFHQIGLFHNGLGYSWFSCSVSSYLVLTAQACDLSLDLSARL
jgi:hypothetical protein